MFGRVKVPGDKSISHRAVMFGALASGITNISGFLPGADCLATIDCFRNMGVTIEFAGNEVKVHGVGLQGLKKPQNRLYVANSGTTIRLLLGILAGQPFTATITGDASIVRRPMRRVEEPLRRMGADISGLETDDHAPLLIRPARLSNITYHMPLASAQVKSAILLAGLYAGGCTTVIESSPSRDHTEIMLAAFGARIIKDGSAVSVLGGPQLTARNIAVPGDISSAAFLMVAGLIVPDSEIVIENVGINPTRTGILDVLKAMGADIAVTPKAGDNIEPLGDIRVRSSSLKAAEIAGPVIPRLIDEIPVIAVAAAFAKGTTVIRDAAELKVKESDRISAIAAGLARMGASVRELPDGLEIDGGRMLSGAPINSYGDHRIAMAFAVAGLRAQGQTEIMNDECVAVSFPGFDKVMAQLGMRIE